MKQLLSLFLFLLPCLALAQYPTNGNQKITLGEQTTADGLIYRGVLADTGIITPSRDTSAYIILDTVNNRFYNYNRATNVWSVTTIGSISSGLTGVLPVANGGTGSGTQNFVDLTTTQTVGGAKTFTSAVTATRFDPTSSSATGTGIFLPVASELGLSTNNTERLRINSTGVLKYGASISNPETTWNELAGFWAIGGTLPNVRLYISSSGGSYGYTSFQARNSASSTPFEIFSSYNLINGRTGIGFIRTADTLAFLTITGSTSVYPSLRIKSGVLTAAASAGAIDNNGTNLFFTPSTTRHTVNHGLTGSSTLNFPSTTTLLSADLTITVTGAADGDVVSLGVPNAAVNANTSYSAWVSAANTVTVRFNNYSSGTVDPASALFKVFVTK
jgi:hypothetical protein